MHKMLSRVAGDVKELKDSKKDLELELASRKGVAVYQTQQIAALKTELEKERSKTKGIFKQFYPSPQQGHLLLLHIVQQSEVSRYCARVYPPSHESLIWNKPLLSISNIESTLFTLRHY
jgi:hypothetical protein